MGRKGPSDQIDGHRGSSPEPVGFRQSRYCVLYLEVILNYDFCFCTDLYHGLCQQAVLGGEGRECYPDLIVLWFADTLEHRDEEAAEQATT